MNIIKAKRGRVKGILTRAAIFAEKVDVDTALSMLEIRLIKLDETWSEFISLQDELYNFAGEKDFIDPEPEFKQYDKLDDKLY